MRDRIAESAQLYRRSMNSEIVARLQDSFSGLGSGLGSGSNSHRSNQTSNQEPIQATHQPTPQPTNQSTNQINEHPGPGLNPHLEHILRQQLDTDEEQILQGYRQLGKAKRDALLKLLSN